MKNISKIKEESGVKGNFFKLARKDRLIHCCKKQGNEDKITQKGHFLVSLFLLLIAIFNKGDFSYFCYFYFLHFH